MFKTRSIQVALFCAVVLLASSPAMAKSYKIATISPGSLGWMKKLRLGTDEIKARTNNRVTFKIYPGGVQGDDFRVLRKMRVGQLHGGVFLASSLTRFYPDLQVYNLPLQFRSRQEISYVRERMDKRIIKGLYDNGLVSFNLIETGFAYIYSKKPIRGIEDLRSAKVWVPDGDEIVAKQIQTFGISPIPLPIIDVLVGLQTGLIDTVVFPPIGVLALQLHNHVQYVTDLPLMYIYNIMSMDKKVFLAMQEADQQVVTEVLNRVFKEVDADNRVDNQKAYAALIKQGLEEVQPKFSQLDSWRATAKISLDELVSSHELSQESVDILLRHLAVVRSASSNKSGE